MVVLRGPGLAGEVSDADPHKEGKKIPPAAALTADLLAAAAGRTAIFITHRPELMAAVAPAVTVRLGA